MEHSASSERTRRELADIDGGGFVSKSKYKIGSGRHNGYYVFKYWISSLGMEHLEYQGFETTTGDLVEGMDVERQVKNQLRNVIASGLKIK